MTPREKNLWGLIGGLVLAIGFGVYKASHSGIAVPTESSSAETADDIPDEPDEMNAAAAGAYDEEGEGVTDVNATDVAATDIYTEEEAKHEIEPPQNLLPGNASIDAAVPSGSTDGQGEVGEE